MARKRLHTFYEYCLWSFSCFLPISVEGQSGLFAATVRVELYDCPPVVPCFLLCFFSFQTSSPVVMVLMIFRVILYFNVYSWKLLMSCLGVSTLLPVEPFIPAASRIVPVSQFRVNEIIAWRIYLFLRHLIVGYKKSIHFVYRKPCFKAFITYVGSHK